MVMVIAIKVAELLLILIADIYLDIYKFTNKYSAFHAGGVCDCCFAEGEATVLRTSPGCKCCSCY